jgi:hypothetical protein
LQALIYGWQYNFAFRPRRVSGDRSHIVAQPKRERRHD